uniref:Podospora anserina S mat+ genomic DNA chromosome 7, supercontig 1 n=1 Tax=Caenorhabditis tropicalis TaxID=1561998 RepID=A0A1I7T9E1_9PELO
MSSPRSISIRKQREHSSKRNNRHRHHRPHEYNQHNTWGFEEEENVQEQKDNSQTEVETIAKKPRPATSLPTTTVDPAEDLKSAIRDAQLGITTTDLPPDPRHNGLLKDVGTIGVGFGVGVGVPGNDPVSVGTGVSVGLDGSGPAGGLPPFAEAIFPRQGELQSLNDYDGNKDLIVSGKALKYIQAVNLGFIQLPKYAPVKSLVGVNSGIGVLGAQAPTGG